MEFMELHHRKLLVLYNFPSCHFKFIVLYCSQKGWYQWTGENLTARTECRVRAMAFFMEWFQRRSAPRSWGIEQMNCVSEWVLVWRSYIADSAESEVNHWWQIPSSRNDPWLYVSKDAAVRGHFMWWERRKALCFDPKFHKFWHIQNYSRSH